MENVYSLLPGASPREAERTLLRHSRSRSSASAGSAGERVSLDNDEELDDFGGGEGDIEIEIERGRRTRSASNGSTLLNVSSRPGTHQKRSSILVKQAGEAIARVKQESILVETGSLGLFKIPDYYLLMIVAYCCTGTGIMWINSVGTVVGEYRPDLG